MAVIAKPTASILLVRNRLARTNGRMSAFQFSFPKSGTVEIYPTLSYSLS